VDRNGISIHVSNDARTSVPREHGSRTDQTRNPYFHARQHGDKPRKDVDEQETSERGGGEPTWRIKGPPVSNRTVDMGRPRIVEGGIDPAFVAVTAAASAASRAASSSYAAVGDPVSSNVGEGDEETTNYNEQQQQKPSRRQRRGPVRSARRTTATTTTTAGGRRAAATATPRNNTSSNRPAVVPAGASSATATTTAAAFFDPFATPPLGLEYPRRYPRIGNAFQAKAIPTTKAVVGRTATTAAAPVPTESASAAAYATSRPRPVLYSTQHPFCTVNQVEEAHGTWSSRLSFLIRAVHARASSLPRFM
jgi:hypothetical protein